MEMVSIIVPIYNQEKYLHRSIESILCQTWKDLDIVLVNDGSTDNSLKIIQSYQIKDKRINIIDQSNQGLVGAVITGINNAKGEYTCFVDPDDFIGKDYVENYMSNIGQFDFVAMGYHSKKEEAIFDYLLLEDGEFNKEDLCKKKNELFNEFGKLNFAPRFGVTRCNKLYKTELLKNILPTYSMCRTISLGEDSIFTFLLLSHAKNCKTLRRVNEYYYETCSDNSMSLHTESTVFYTKIVNTRECFREILKDYDTCIEQADYLFFLLCNNLLVRTRFSNDFAGYSKAFRLIHDDSVYNHVFREYKDTSKRGRIKNYLWEKIKSARLHYMLTYVLDALIRAKDSFDKAA